MSYLFDPSFKITPHQNRKLKAVWSYEAAQDMKSMHNLDAEAELTKALADAINAEIDAEVLADLRELSGQKDKEKEWGFKKKKKPAVRKITEDWEPSKLD